MQTKVNHGKLVQLKHERHNNKIYIRRIIISNLLFFVENPPLAIVVKLWFKASKKVISPTIRKIISNPVKPM